MEWEFAISKIGQKELPLQPLKHRLKTTRIGILITRFGSPRFGGLIRRLSARSLTECGSGDLSRKCQENIEKTSRVSKREMRFVLLVRIISFRAPAIPFGQLIRLPSDARCETTQYCVPWEFGTNSVKLRERKNGFPAPKRHKMKHLDFLILLLESRRS